MVLLPKSSSRMDPAPVPRSGGVVLYENNGIPILGTIVKDGGKQCTVLNLKGSEVSLPPNRLYLVPGSIGEDLTKQEKTTRLSELDSKARALISSIDLATIWESIKDDRAEITTREICELFFGKNDSVEHLATRYALLHDPVYFKRNRETFSPRAFETVEELKHQVAVEQAKLRRKNLLIESIKGRLKGSTDPLPSEVTGEIRMLAELAAGRVTEEGVREARDLLRLILDETKLSLFGTAEQKAFELLVKIGELKRHSDLSLIRHSPVIDFSKAELAAAEALSRALAERSEEFPFPDSKREDLTALECFTIDDASTMDMDDAVSFYRKDGELHLGIHISDLGSVIRKDSVLEGAARKRATSFYCPDYLVNMLPPNLSQEALSLVADKERRAISYLFTFDSDFRMKSQKIVPSFITVRTRLNYEEVDKILETGHPEKESAVNVAANLDMLHQLTTALEMKRVERGAAKYERRDVLVQADESGAVSIKEYNEDAPSRVLVGELMILVNEATALEASKSGVSFIFRAQPESEEPRTNVREIPPGPALDFALRASLSPSYTSLKPERHVTLGIDAYLQITSPIRRYVDLINQRQLLHMLFPEFEAHTDEELDQIRAVSEEALSLARAVSRERKKYWLLVYLDEMAKRKETIEGTIVRKDPRMTLVELEQIYIIVPAHVRDGRGLGDRVSLRINRVEPHWNVLKLEEI